MVFILDLLPHYSFRSGYLTFCLYWPIRDVSDPDRREADEKNTTIGILNQRNDEPGDEHMNPSPSKSRGVAVLLLSAVTDAEPAVRGYIIMGNDAFAKPYQAAANAHEDTLRRVRLVADQQRSGGRG